MEMYYLKQQVDRLHSTLEVFDGCAPVRMLSFSTTLRDTFDTIRVSEVAPVRVLAYHLGGAAKDTLSE